MPLPDPNYFYSPSLQEYFVDKDTGFPLAAGRVQFFSDPAYSIPKDVYQQVTGTPNFTYVNLGSELTLSSVVRLWMGVVIILFHTYGLMIRILVWKDLVILSFIIYK